MWDLTVRQRPRCGSGLACADHYLTDAPRRKGGSGLAREGGVSVGISVAAVTAAEGSALTAGHFWKDPKVTKRSSPHPSAPRLGSVCPHAGLNPWAAAMGHPWPSAANPASCRVTHGFKPAFGQRGLTGRLRSKSKADLLICGSGLACDGGPRADHYSPDAPRPKGGSGLAREGGVSVGISVAAVTAAEGSALTAGHFWKDPKVTKRSSPHPSAPRLGSVCPHSGLNPWAAAMGHPWPSAANPAYCRVAHGFKPAFGQRGLTGRLRSKSKADLFFCGSGLACDGGPRADHYSPDAPHPKCGSGLAREGGVLVGISVAAVTAAEGSALTAGHFWKDPKVTKRSSPHPSAPRLGSVCPHSGLNPWAAAMGHPWPSAANPASCRVAHGFKPAFGQRGLTGRLRSKSKSKADLLFCGSWLACAGGPRADHYSPNAPRPKGGSGLAREGGVSVADVLPGTSYSRASPLPHSRPSVSNVQQVEKGGFPCIN